MKQDELIQTALGLLPRDVLDWLIGLSVLGEDPNKSNWAKYDRFRILGTKAPDNKDVYLISRVLREFEGARMALERTRPEEVVITDPEIWMLLKRGKLERNYTHNGVEYQTIFVYDMNPLDMAVRKQSKKLKMEM